MECNDCSFLHLIESNANEEERERQSKKHNQCKQANLSEGVQRQTKPRRWKENIAHQEIEERKEINDNSIKCQCN